MHDSTKTKQFCYQSRKTTYESFLGKIGKATNASRLPVDRKCPKLVVLIELSCLLIDQSNVRSMLNHSNRACDIVVEDT